MDTVGAVFRWDAGSGQALRMVNIPTFNGGQAPNMDHPRACGEKKGKPLSKTDKEGSPPRMRGKAIHYRAGTLESGITPAHAGKSTISGHLRFLVRDHPRACGEKWHLASTVLCKRGSPPRMRGKDGSTIASWMPSGITPAHAGKRPCRCTSPRRCWDHPRACREKFPLLLLNAPGTG